VYVCVQFSRVQVRLTYGVSNWSMATSWRTFSTCFKKAYHRSHDESRFCLLLSDSVCITKNTEYHDGSNFFSL